MALLAEANSRLSVEIRGDIRPLELLPHALLGRSLIATSDAVESDLEFASERGVHFELPWAEIYASRTRLTIHIESPDRFEAAMDLIQALAADQRGADDGPPLDHLRYISASVTVYYESNAQTSGAAMLDTWLKNPLGPEIRTKALRGLRLEVTLDQSSADLCHVSIEPSPGDEQLAAKCRFVWDRAGEHSDETPLVRAQREWSSTVGLGTKVIRSVVSTIATPGPSTNDASEASKGDKR